LLDTDRNVFKFHNIFYILSLTKRPLSKKVLHFFMFD